VAKVAAAAACRGKSMMKTQPWTGAIFREEEMHHGVFGNLKD
jgi:hypothetical protein